MKIELHLDDRLVSGVKTLMAKRFALPVLVLGLLLTAGTVLATTFLGDFADGDTLTAKALNDRFGGVYAAVNALESASTATNKSVTDLAATVPPATLVARYTNSKSTLLINNDTTVVPFDGESFSNLGATMGAQSSDTFVTPAKGKWQVCAKFFLQEGTWGLGSRVELATIVAGSTYSVLSYVTAETTASVERSINGCDVYALNAGDKVQLRFESHAGVDLKLGGGIGQNYVTFAKLSD